MSNCIACTTLANLLLAQTDFIVARVAMYSAYYFQIKSKVISHTKHLKFEVDKFENSYFVEIDNFLIM